jgi:hypothetical protein
MSRRCAVPAPRPDFVVEGGVAGAVGRGVAILGRELPGGAVLVVERGLGRLDQALAAGEAVVEADAVARSLSKAVRPSTLVEASGGLAMALSTVQSVSLSRWS